MKRSETRLLTTHVGSLPRSPALRDLLVRYDRGEAKGWYHLRERRDLARGAGQPPDRHPTAGELEYRRLQRRHGRATWWLAREAQVRRALGVGEDLP